MPVCASLVLGDSTPWQSCRSWHTLANLCGDFVWQRLAQVKSISTHGCNIFTSLQFHLKGQRGSNSIMGSARTENLEFSFCFSSHVDKQCVALGLTSCRTHPFSHQRRYKVQPCKATRVLSGGGARFYIYQLSKESARFAICSQRRTEIKASGCKT